MRPLPAVLAFAIFSLLVSATAQPAAKSNAGAGLRPSDSNGQQELPIHRVVLYKNGVGYFEHRGRVTGDQELNIRFTTAQLNDVLKSLTVVDLGGGKIGGVRYNSIAPLSQRLSTLRLALDGNTDRASFLNALRGARVEVRSGASSATGRLLSVEEVTRLQKDDREIKATEISLVSDSGELHTFELTPATGVRVLEGEMTREVSRYMALLASSRDKDVRQMTISTSGQGERELVVSYISEVPVWKSTYRIVLPENPAAKALLQGWAVVDNTVGEDWKNVQLSLVAGAPQSFVEQISQPYYVRRPVVELPKSAQLTPQTHEGAENVAVTHAVPAEAAYGAAGGVLGGIMSASPAAAPKQKKAAGGGIGAGRYNANETVEVNAADANALTESYEQSFEAQSTGEALGDMFEYAIKQNVTVLQNQSALVPIVQARVEAEKVTLWNEKERSPLRALWLTNSSGLTLDAGSFNIVESGAFAGEGLLSEIHPNERRLLSYAADTAVRVKSTGSSEQKPYTRLRAARGILILTRELRETRTYIVTNTDTSARSVVIEHPARNGWHFLDPNLKPEESSNSYYRFRIKVAPASGEKLVVAEYYPQETTYALSNISSDIILMVLKTRDLQPDVEAALRKLLAKRDEIAAVQNTLNQRHQDVEAINNEQERIRENMKSLKGSAEEKALLQRYVSSLNQQEDRLAELKKEISTKELELNARQNEYNQMAESISFDQTH
jgi:hypothetical protein